MSSAGRQRLLSSWWLAAVLAATLLAATFLAACTDEGESDLTVFAAASLRDVVSELETAWLDEHPGTPLTVASEASNVLAARIREGAPADVFLSADTERPQELARQGHTAAQPVPLARNALTLVVPAAGEAVATPADLARPGVRIVSTSPGAPITRYARQIIDRLAASQPRPDAWLAAVEANIVSREDNVRAALAKVELGEADAAFVYLTDLRGATDVRPIALPGWATVRASYAAVQVSQRPPAAEFVAWLAGPEAQRVIAMAGFEVPG
ncbi:MAG: molybdate ABC transporter substrate-binding protein [Chloroflexota bacterium]